MSPRASGVDESGRPIVAELGRAETPQETADRKAAASAKRRANQTILNLAIATVASALVAVGIVWTVGLVDTGSRIDPVDYVAVGEAAQGTVDEQLVVPQLPDGWQANRAELVRGSDGVTSWQIGFVTPEKKYIAVVQGIEANPSWLADQVRDAKAGEQLTTDGVAWTSYDRRTTSDPGNVAYALVTTAGDSTIVLAGTAGDTEFEQLATAIAKELT